MDDVGDLVRICPLRHTRRAEDVGAARANGSIDEEMAYLIEVKVVRHCCPLHITGQSQDLRGRHHLGRCFHWPTSLQPLRSQLQKAKRGGGSGYVHKGLRGHGGIYTVRQHLNGIAFDVR